MQVENRNASLECLRSDHLFNSNKVKMQCGSKPTDVFSVQGREIH